MLNIKLSIIKLSDIILRFWGISLILLKSIVIYLFLIIVFAHTTPSIDQSSIVSKTSTNIATSNLILEKVEPSINKKEIIQLSPTQKISKIVNILMIMNNPLSSSMLERSLKFYSFQFYSFPRCKDIYPKHPSLIFVDNNGKSNIKNWNDLINSQVKYVIHAQICLFPKDDTSLYDTPLIVDITHDISNLSALNNLVKFCNPYRLAKYDFYLTIIQILQDQIHALLRPQKYSIQEIFNNKLLDDVYTDINKECTNTIALFDKKIKLSNLENIYNVKNEPQGKKLWIDLIQLISNIFSELNSQFQTNNNIKQNNIKQNIITLIKTNYGCTIQELQRRIKKIESTQIHIAILENDNITQSILKQS